MATCAKSRSIPASFLYHYINPAGSRPNPQPVANDINTPTILNALATRYLDALGLAHKVKVESGQFTTTSLSAGQRKRMALVSSYLEDRPVCLFDEWAADQYPTFKRIFYRELLPELKSRGKTVIVISHDDAYFDCADRIVTLFEGTLTIVDTPAERSSQSIHAEPEGSGRETQSMASSS
jgi:ABC-type siderophore export system fused ATPase/permease subunit